MMDSTVEKINEEKIQVKKRKRKVQPKNKFCKKCDWRTNHTNHLRAHMKNNHNIEIEMETRKCTICDFQTKSRQELKKHKQQFGHRNRFFL